MWVLFAFLSAFFAGATAILAKIGVKNVDSDLATALRTVVVLLFSWLMAWIAGSIGGIGDIAPKTLLFLGLSGLATGASWLCYFRALKLGTVSRVTPIDKSSTILTMLLAFLLLGEGLTVIKVAAMLLIGGGTYLMIAKPKDKSEKTKPESRAWLIYAILSAVFASLTSILGKIGVEGVDSTLGTAIRTIVVLAMAWAIVFAKGGQKKTALIDKKSWVFLVLSGIATGASWLCYYHALKNGQASVVVPIDKLSILVTIAFSAVVLKEKISLKSGAGLALITGGTLMLLI